MKIKSALSMMVIMVLALVSIGAVSATSPDYDIGTVKVNDRVVSSSDVNSIVVERGDSVDVEVWLNGQVGGQVRDDVRVKAWVGGYEHSEVFEKTKMFKVESDGSYKKSLIVDLPNDLDADKNGDAESYTLHVEAFDSNNDERQSFTLKVDEKRHDLRIVDVIFRPGTTVNANDMLFTTVRVENMGDKKEEDIQVRVSIPELGFLARDYVDELVPHDSDNDDEEKSGDVDLWGRIPKNAESKEYEVKVELVYNRGHETVTEDYVLNVEGRSSGLDVDSVVSVDSTVKAASLGESTAYKVMIANFGDERVVYSAEVLGVGTWGSASVDPAFVAINAGDTGELFVKVTPNAAGDQSFTVKVKADGAVVKELNLSADVSGSQFGDVRRGLEIGFAVLAILLVILGLIIAFTKLRSDDGEGEEPELESGEESAGQTYY
jgi:hypothetical protein